MVVCPHRKDPVQIALDWQSNAWEARCVARTEFWNQSGTFPPDHFAAKPDEQEKHLANLWDGESTLKSATAQSTIVLKTDNADAAVLRVVTHLNTQAPVPVSNPVTFGTSSKPIATLRLGDWRSLGPAQELYNLGFPVAGGQTPTPTMAWYAGPLVGDPNGAWLKLQALVMPGDSGGPVVTTSGYQYQSGHAGPVTTTVDPYTVIGWNVRNQLSDERSQGLNEIRPMDAGEAVIDAALTHPSLPSPASGDFASFKSLF